MSPVYAVSYVSGTTEKCHPKRVAFCVCGVGFVWGEPPFDKTRQRFAPGSRTTERRSREAPQPQGCHRQKGFLVVLSVILE